MIRAFCLTLCAPVWYYVHMSDGLISLIKAEGVCGADVVLLDETFGAENGAIASEEDTRMHTHSYYELFFCDDRSVKITLVSDENTFTSGVVIVPPSFRHYATVERGTYRFFVKTEEKGDNPFARAAESNEIVFARVNKDVFFYLEKIRDCLKKGARDEQKITALVKLVLLEVADGLDAARTRTEAARIKPDAEYSFKIEKIISGCLQSKITLGDAADRLYLSKKQTSRIIMKNYGMPLCKVIADRRLTVAALMLKNTGKSVSEIAEETGFNTECRFFSLFRQKYGVTPLVYRKTESKR